MIFATCKAPAWSSLLIVMDEPVQPCKQLIHAIGIVEASGDTLAYNEPEQACGYFQIRPIRLLDYNQRTGHKYKMQDMYNFEISKEIFLFYASYLGGTDLELIAKRWNGSGPKTEIYWDKVKLYL